MSNCFCHLNGYEVKDAQARKDIEDLKQSNIIADGKIDELTNSNIQNKENIDSIIETNEQLSNSVDNLILLSSGLLNVKQFGAKGDGVTDDTSAIKQAISYLRTYPRETNDYSELYFPNGTYVVSDTLLIENGRWSKIHGKATIKANMNKPIFKFLSCMWLTIDGLRLEQENTGDNANGIDIENTYTCKFVNMTIEGGNKAINDIYGNQLMIDNVSCQNNKYGFFTQARGNNTENILINSTFEGSTEYNLYFGYDDVHSDYGKFIVTNCYIEGETTKSLVYVHNGMHVSFENCYLNHLVENGTLFTLNGTIPVMKVYVKDSILTSNGKKAYAFKSLSNSIEKGAFIDNITKLGEYVELYNSSDTIKPKILSLIGKDLDVYNFSALNKNENQLIGWSNGSQPTYSFSDSVSEISENTIDITSNGYIYKEIYLKEGVTYDISALVKNTGSGYASIEVWNTELSKQYKTVNIYNTSFVNRVLTYTPDESKKYRIFVRNNQTTKASFCGLKLTSYEL